MIVIAIHSEAFDPTLTSLSTEVTRGKVVIDVTNRQHRKCDISNAEQLAAIFPSAAVVKAFNTVPALAFDPTSGIDQTRVKVRT